MAFVLVLIACLCIAGWLAYRAVSRQRVHRTLLATPLSGEQRAIVAEQVPLTARLPAGLRDALEGKINAFLNQVEFIGCDGLDVTDEMRLSIAAQACLLIVNSDAWYTNLRTILMYPGAFASLKAERDGFVVTERRTVRLGESWVRGPVVLSWKHSAEGAADDHDGHNVVLHEFAHQLDNLSGRADGAPVLAKGHSFAAWEHAILEAFERHRHDVEAGRPTDIDAYGATSHPEYFAVVVELFFERPKLLRRAEPHVYEQLCTLLSLDPATWPDTAQAG